MSMSGPFGPLVAGSVTTFGFNDPETILTRLEAAEGVAVTDTTIQRSRAGSGYQPPWKGAPTRSGRASDRCRGRTRSRRCTSPRRWSWRINNG